MPTSHILVVSDRPVVRFAYKELLQREGYPARVRRRSEIEGPDTEILPETRVVILDMIEEDFDGPKLLKEIASGSASPGIIVIAELGYSVFLRRFAHRCVDGTLTLKSELEAIVDAVRTVAWGGTYRGPGESEVEDMLQKFTNRELEVFFLMGKGFRPRQIAETLSISDRTVNRHRENIRKKLPADEMGEVDRMAAAVVAGTFS